MITLAARKEKGVQICNKIGSILYGIRDFLLHAIFIFPPLSGNQILRVTGRVIGNFSPTNTSSAAPIISLRDDDASDYGDFANSCKEK